MSSDHQECFKIFFGQEIHRLPLNHPLPTWEEFLEKLRSVVQSSPSLLWKDDLQVRYKDDEGDMITVSSEIEWKEALSNALSKQRVKRFYISFGPALRCPFSSPFPPPPSSSSSSSCMPHSFEGAKENVGFPNFETRRRMCQRGWRRNFHVEKLHQKGISAMERGEYEWAKKAFERILQIDKRNAIALYNVACCDSLLGHKQQAIDSLRRAVRFGYRNFSHMAQDPDLENISNEAEFLKLLVGDQSEGEKKKQVVEQVQEQEQEQEERKQVVEETVKEFEKLVENIMQDFSVKLEFFEKEGEEKEKEKKKGEEKEKRRSEEKKEEQIKGNKDESSNEAGCVESESDLCNEKEREAQIQEKKNMELFHEMGFKNDELLRMLLQKNEGDFSAALSELLV